jgi:PRD1 phage membrane DNA delivery
MNSITEAIVTILLMIGGIALASVLVSRNANTTGVIQAGASGFSNALAVAQSPVTGASISPNLGYPSQPDFSAAFGGN